MPVEGPGRHPADCGDAGEPRRTGAEAGAAEAPQPPAAGVERRASERLPLNAGADLLSPSLADDRPGLPVVVLDISEGGAALLVPLTLHTSAPLTPGTAARLCLELPPHGVEAELDVLVRSIEPTEDLRAFIAHCSFEEVPLRTQWQVVRACVALGDALHGAPAEFAPRWTEAKRVPADAGAAEAAAAAEPTPQASAPVAETSTARETVASEDPPAEERAAGDEASLRAFLDEMEAPSAEAGMTGLVGLLEQHEADLVERVAALREELAEAEEDLAHLRASLQHLGQVRRLGPADDSMRDER